MTRVAIDLPPIPDAPTGVWYRSELQSAGVNAFDEGDELPPEFRQLIVQVVSVQADLESELVFDSSYFRNFMLAAPTPRSRMRMAKFYSEEVNHGYTFWEIAKGLGVEFSARYFREAKRIRQEAFTKVDDVRDWLELGIVNTLTDRMGVFVFKDMITCSYLPWARVSARIAKDEAGHAALGVANLRDGIALGGLEQAQQYLEKWYPLALDMFGRSVSARQWRYIAWGIKRSPNEALRQAWVREVNPILEDLGLRVPSYDCNRKFK
jgi:ring-1,2-phenylacetyl-CoA epoxidase subunit PaaA